MVYLPSAWAASLLEEPLKAGNLLESYPGETFASSVFVAMTLT
jgi:hypothetical protein